MSEEQIKIQEPNQLKKIERDENGLIKGLDYQFLPDGMINWKAIIPPEFLYINPSNKPRIEKKYGKPYSELDPIKDNIKDTDLVILLAGIKFLGKIRGFNKVHYTIKEANESYTCVNCMIEFIGNYETEGRTICFEDNACATPNNTNGFGRNYLIEMSTNRAFCRTVRSFLNLAIVSREELGTNTEDDSNNSQSNPQIEIFSDLMKKKNYTFEQIKKKLVTEKYLNAENFKELSDIPKEKMFELIERLKKKTKDE